MTCSSLPGVAAGAKHRKFPQLKIHPTLSSKRRPLQGGRLRYRSVNQQQVYKTLEMLSAEGTNQYWAVVPAEQVVSKWDFMYLIEVMDRHGNGKIYPDLNREMPYVVVKLQR